MFAIPICLKFESDNYKLIPCREQLKSYDHGGFELSFIYQIFRETILSESTLIVFALSIAFTRYSSIQLFELLMRIPIISSGFNKTLIYFLRKMNFDGIRGSDMLLNLAI
jgi:hypothetical protein